MNMDKSTISQENTSVTHGRGYVYSLRYHIVWVTKYRKPIFVGEIEEEIKDYQDQNIVCFLPEYSAL